MTLDICTTVTKELTMIEFGNFVEKMKQQKQEWKKLIEENKGIEYNIVDIVYLYIKGQILWENIICG